MLSVEAARAKVMEIITERAAPPATETVEFARDPSRAVGRVLAENVSADRNYPPFNRSIRDGFALRSADAAQPGSKLRQIGESRAGVAFNGTVAAGECVRIFTGAPVPRGADAVVMQEYTRTEADFVVFEKAVRAGQQIVFEGAEARVGEVVVKRGTRLSFAELAMAAEVGQIRVAVTRRPRVAILSTGDEVVEVEQTPGPYQIRNGNSISLSAQVTLAGGEPVMLPNARDDLSELRARIEQGLESDILVLSGGVSVGKYDLVEQALRELGAEFFFDAVALRPGKPAVFGWCKEKPVFGLPGNPVSTMLTFELFAVPAIELLSGYEPQPLPFFRARLAHTVNEKGDVQHFLPARVNWPGGQPTVELMLWEGSGDVAAVVRGNCFLVVEGSKLQLDAGEWVNVLPRRGSF
ncbi:MAG: molybdopterin molybdotransferase MoeA [Candidatus Acidiferrales bacterium]